MNFDSLPDVLQGNTICDLCGENKTEAILVFQTYKNNNIIRICLECMDNGANKLKKYAEQGVARDGQSLAGEARRSAAYKLQPGGDMSQNNMELMVWGDGKPRLTFWDNEHGDDKVFVLNEDGTATLETYEGNEDIEVFQAGPVNLVEELRKMAFVWDAQRQEIFNHIKETRQSAEQVRQPDAKNAA